MKTACVSPEWFQKGSVYQVNPRTFSAEGTIAAVTKALPRLAEMGFSVIYFCPLFEADTSQDRDFWSIRQKASNTNNPKNPYRMMDYFRIDDEYGTLGDLRDCIQTAHTLGLKVLLDLVYLHIGPNAYVIQQHPEFIQRDESGNPKLTYWNFPYLNFENAGLREYLWSNMTYFIGHLDADGFRCDVADNVPLSFWAEGKRRITAIKPDAVLINEGQKAAYLEDVFHCNYGWSWHERIFEVITDAKTADAIRAEHERVRAEYPKGGLVLRDMDNHDTVTDWPDRIENLVGHDGMEMLLALNYMIDGIPMVYCGNELADTAKLSMFANRFHMGAFAVTDRNATGTHVTRRMQIIRTLNTLRKTVCALSAGETVWLDTPKEILAFERRAKDETAVFIANFGKTTQTVPLPGGIADTLLSNNAVADDTTVTLEPYGYLAYVKYT
ncbi:MAG: alpha-glucosidase C-terminal domain-containing protein [Clostridia bacterium]|nr:alpha-glucosidase C-terminal domain-containing protein [Clostridia bacterium]